MQTPGTKEDAENGLPHEPQWNAIRLVRIALWRERRHTERLLKEHVLGIRSEIGLTEEKILAKLESIDTSVSLIAGEIARRSGDPPPSGTGS